MSRDVGWIVTEWDSTARAWSAEGASPWPPGRKARAEEERDAFADEHGGTWGLAMVTLAEGTAVGPERAESLR